MYNVSTMETQHTASTWPAGLIRAWVAPSLQRGNAKTIKDYMSSGKSAHNDWLQARTWSLMQCDAHCLPSHSPSVHALGIRFRVCLPCHGTRCHRMPQHAATCRNMPQQSKRYRAHIWHLIPVDAESLSKVDAKQSRKSRQRGTKGRLEEHLGGKKWNRSSLASNKLG